MNEKIHDWYKKRYKKDFKPAYDALMKFYPLTLEDLDGEQWADIAGYEGLYQVSTFGRVKSFARGKKILKVALRRNGYLIANLLKNGQRKQPLIHRLVAKAFIPNPQNKPEVNHIYSRFSNHVDCLEWATSSENQLHAVRTGLKKIGEDNHLAKLTKEQVVYIRENPERLSGRQLAKKFKVPPQRISKIQLGKTWRTTSGTVREAYVMAGGNSPNAKISNKQRIEIRTEYSAGGVSQSSLAIKYGVSQQTICNIIKGN